MSSWAIKEGRKQRELTKVAELNAHANINSARTKEATANRKALVEKSLNRKATLASLRTVTCLADIELMEKSKDSGFADKPTRKERIVQQLTRLKNIEKRKVPKNLSALKVLDLQELLREVVATMGQEQQEGVDASVIREAAAAEAMAAAAAVLAASAAAATTAAAEAAAAFEARVAAAAAAEATARVEAALAAPNKRPNDDRGAPQQHGSKRARMMASGT